MDNSYSTPVDPHSQLQTALFTTQIEIWLLEVRAADVRSQLQQCRTRRAGLGRQYRRLLAHDDRAE